MTKDFRQDMIDSCLVLMDYAWPQVCGGWSMDPLFKRGHRIVPDLINYIRTNYLRKTFRSGTIMQNFHYIVYVDLKIHSIFHFTVKIFRPDGISTLSNISSTTDIKWSLLEFWLSSHDLSEYLITVFTVALLTWRSSWEQHGEAAERELFQAYSLEYMWAIN